MTSQAAVVAELFEQVARLMHSVDTLTDELANLRQTLQQQTTSTATRSRRHVVVCGLPESRDTDDVTSLANFCLENRLPLTTSDVTTVKRLGSMATNRRPRRLLVAFESEQRARDMLRTAGGRSLMTSSGERVYVNRDLNPAERQRDFERRQRRRRTADATAIELHL